MYSNRSFTTREAMELGVSKRMLSHLVQGGHIERVARGVYIISTHVSGEDFQFEDLAYNAKSYKNAVICLLSALSYWDLTDEIPRQFWLAIPNNQPIPKTRNNIKFYRPRNLKMGIIEKSIAGEKVRITSPERTIVDCFKYFDEETNIKSLDLFLSEKKRMGSIVTLFRLAHSLKANKLIEILTQISNSQAKNYPNLNNEDLRQTIEILSETRNKDE